MNLWRLTELHMLQTRAKSLVVAIAPNAVYETIANRILFGHNLKSRIQDKVNMNSVFKHVDLLQCQLLNKSTYVYMRNGIIAENVLARQLHAAL